LIGVIGKQTDKVAFGNKSAQSGRKQVREQTSGGKNGPNRIKVWKKVNKSSEQRAEKLRQQINKRPTNLVRLWKVLVITTYPSLG
jgi:hypothetical protein